jgi:exosome complex RNA-binding protein Csl4
MSEEYPEWCSNCGAEISSSRDNRKCENCGRIGCWSCVTCLDCKKCRDNPPKS